MSSSSSSSRTPGGNWSAFGNNNQRRQFPGSFGGGDRRDGGDGGRRDGGDRRDGNDRGQRQFPAAFGGGRRDGGGNDRRDGGGRAFGGGERRRYPRNDAEQDRQAAADAEAKQQEEEKSREFNDVNFPSLVSSFSTGAGSGHAWHQRGSDLAKAWSDAAEQQKMLDAQEKVHAARTIQMSSFSNAPLPLRNASTRFTRPDYYAEDAYPEDRGAPAPAPAPAPDEEDDWTQVNPKKRQATNRQTSSWNFVQKASSNVPAAEDTVWGEEEANDAEETVWH
jgi:hypothetical protein